MMALKRISLVIVVCLCLASSADPDPITYQNYTSAIYDPEYLAIQIVCGEKDNLLNILWTNYGDEEEGVRKISFRKCDVSELEPFFFTSFGNVKVFDISNMSLRNLPSRSIRETTSIEMLNASGNQITEIPWYSFSNYLKRAYFSNNFITNLAPEAFEGAYNLEELDLSLNPLNSLKVGTFAYLTNLKVLSLLHTNLTSIEFGTFAFQHNLMVLDLSLNHLKELDFNNFSPTFPYMQKLFLFGNDLTQLKHFENSLLPKLTLLDIGNNNFNCSYLQEFMESVDWENLNTRLTTIMVDITKTNIGGVTCDIV